MDIFQLKMLIRACIGDYFADKDLQIPYEDYLRILRHIEEILRIIESKGYEMKITYGGEHENR